MNVNVNVVVVVVVVVVALALGSGCRRKHVDPTASEPPAVTAAPTEPAPATAPPANPSNPLNEPVLAPRNDRPTLPDGGTLNDDPRGPRPAEWQAIVDRSMPALQACFDRANLPPGEIAVTMHYTVELPGYTGAVTATGPAPKPVLECCTKIVEELKFPEYRGAKVERDLAFTWVKRAPSTDGGATKK